MIETSSYLVFLFAAVTLILMPGPSQALVFANTISRGSRDGALTALGLNIGTLLHAVVAGLGLSAVLATSALAFSIVKYAGAAYLLYLGIRAWCAKSQVHTGNARSAVPMVAGRVLAQAVLAGVLNPKVALFFLAFLPQFVDSARGPVLPQFLVLGSSMAVLDTLYSLVIVRIARRLQRNGPRSPWMTTVRDRFSGAVMILLGLRLAVQER